MSAQNHAVGTKLKDKNPAPNGVLEVTVQGKLGDSGIFPETITLTNGVHTVRWICNDLPQGAVLQVHFPEDLRGPFVDLVQSQSAVSGYGNRGPRATLEEYAYEARIVDRSGASRPVGQGKLINKATRRIPDPRRGGPDTQPEPINT